MTVRLCNGSAFGATEGQSIYQAARDNGILFDHSCLTGRCSSCRGKLMEGQTQKLKDELGLTQEEKDGGYILTCVRAAASDIKLDIEAITGIPPLASPTTVPCKVSRFEYITDDLMELELRFPPNQQISFLPGQYVNLIKGAVRRSYSIAGAENGKLLFFIKNYPGGEFSKYLFSTIKVNDLLRMHGPLGTFCYRNNEVSHSIFLATGTGIAPIKAILDDLNQHPERTAGKALHLYYGVRKAAELMIKPDYPNLNLNYYPCLSRETKTDCYQGYIQDILLGQNLSLADSEVYACGSPKMIAESQQKLTEHGLHKNLFYSDAFLISS